MREVSSCARPVMFTRRPVEHAAEALRVASHRRDGVQWLKSLFGAGPKRGGPRPKQNEKSTASGGPCQVCIDLASSLCAVRHTCAAHLLNSTFSLCFSYHEHLLSIDCYSINR